MNPSPPELFPQRPVRSDFGRAPSYRMRRIITVTVTVAVIAGGARLIFGSPFSHSGEIATIKAEGAWKQKPQQPGGIDIPNQDVQVYQALDSKDNTKAPVEHLLPPPETPQMTPSASTASSEPNTAAPPALAAPSSEPSVESLTPPKLEIDNIATTVSPSAPPPVSDMNTVPPAPVATPAVTTESPPSQVAPSLAAPPAAAPAPVSAPVSPVAQVATPLHVVKAKPPVQASLTMAQVLKDAKSTPKTNRIVQVASVQDQASAEAMAEKMQIRYASILGTAQLRVVQADVAGKGTYYRIQSQPVPGDHASGICAALQKMKAGCILVRP